MKNNVFLNNISYIFYNTMSLKNYYLLVYPGKNSLLSHDFLPIKFNKLYNSYSDMVGRVSGTTPRIP